MSSKMTTKEILTVEYDEFSRCFITVIFGSAGFFTALVAVLVNLPLF